MMEKNLNKESGNVLFLILIAVALFAALSYAVTSSTNSGGGNANEESTLVNSAAISQYPASIKTVMLRMQVSRGVAETSLNFDKPPYDDLATVTEGVFHPSGGGATYTPANADVMAAGTPGQWYFNRDFEIEDIGTTGAGEAGNDIVAFLPGISDSICDRINTQLGVGTVVADRTLTSAPTFTVNINDAYTVSTANPAANSIGTTLGATALDGQPYGCVTDSGGQNIYYHVLSQR